MSDLLQKRLEEQQRAVVITEFTVPKSLCADGGPKTIGMRALTAEMELLAAKLGKHDYMRGQYNATKMAIVELGGVRVKDREDVDRFWEHASPKLRTLLLKAYDRMSSPAAEEEDGFFASETVKV